LNGTLAKEELVKAAIKILKDPEPWWKNSLKVAEKYSWERTTELWKSLLNRLYLLIFNRSGAMVLATTKSLLLQHRIYFHMVYLQSILLFYYVLQIAGA